MFDLRRDYVLAVSGVCFGYAADREVIGFGAAGYEDYFAGGRVYKRSDPAPSLLHRGLCALSERVHRLRVAHLLREVWQHRVHDLGRYCGRCTVVQVDSHENFGVISRVLELFVPGHLYRLEFFFVRTLGIAAEAIEFHHPTMQIGEAHAERINVWMSFEKPDSYFLGVGPIKIRHLVPSVFLASRSTLEFAPRSCSSMFQAVSYEIQHVGYLNSHISRYNALATEPRMKRQTVSHVESVFLVFVHLSQIFFALLDDDMTGCAGAIPAARVLKIETSLDCNV